MCATESQAIRCDQKKPSVQMNLVIRWVQWLEKNIYAVYYIESSLFLFQ